MMCFLVTQILMVVCGENHEIAINLDTDVLRITWDFCFAAEGAMAPPREEEGREGREEKL